MSSPAAPQPIIVIRKKNARHGHHGGAWKVAYADFVTAMMALFIVLWLLSSDEKVKKAVGGYFQDPTGQGKQTGTTMAGTGEGILLDQDNMDQLKQKLEAAMKELPQIEQLKKNVEMTVTNEGLRIELLEKEGGLFFESGSPKPSAKGAELLHLLAQQLSKLPNSLLIEGHTDAKPYASVNGYSNWELSADRANTARRLLTESGIPMERIGQVRGFADRRLRDKLNAFNPENRRISVLVQYMEPQMKPPSPPPKPPHKG
ncbi:MAG: OmpA family protein [Bryobacteraceae bacterium]|nr:OmpA family protein [Bryobacteraceae bacterium]